MEISGRREVQLSTADRSAGHDAVLVITSPPVGIEFGIDCITYETGPKFRGLTMIPPGLHFLYYGTGMGARQGYFLEAARNQVLVHSWDTQNEQILPTHSLSPEALGNLHLCLARGDLNFELGPYPLHQHHLWKNNSGFISAEVLAKAHCSPGTLLYPGDEADVFDGQDTTSAAVLPASSAEQPHFRDLASTACFTDLKAVEAALLETVPRGEGRTAELTRRMLDKSLLLAHLVETQFGGDASQLLGELQLAYMLFMLLYSYPALQHWKALVATICCCDAYLAANPNFTSAFMRVFYSQLSFSPTDFFEAELSRENFLGPVVASLFSALDGYPLGAKSDHLEEHRRRLLGFLRKKFSLFDGMEDGADQSDNMAAALHLGVEDAPVYVSAEEIAALRLYGGVDQAEDSDSSDMKASQGGVLSVEVDDRSACSARWSAIDAQIMQHAAVGMVVDNLQQIEVSASMGTAPPPTSEAPPLNRRQLEAARFGWRYPLLFDHSDPEREDLTMAAARVLEQTALLTEADGALLAYKVRQEALAFVRDEVALLSR